MKGSAHAAIGVGVGCAIALTCRMNFADGALCVAVGAFSALSPDLDGQGMLTSKLGKTSRAVHRSIFGLGLLLALWGLYQYFVQHRFDPGATASAAAVFALGGVLKVGLIRNIMVSVIGGAVIVAGSLHGMKWLAGLGLFIAVVPWLKHRGFTHTIWCNLIWAAIGWGMERQTGVSGLALAAAAGYFSHLAADTLTPGGVKWLYPLVRTTFRIPVISRR